MPDAAAAKPMTHTVTQHEAIIDMLPRPTPRPRRRTMIKMPLRDTRRHDVVAISRAPRSAARCCRHTMRRGADASASRKDAPDRPTLTRYAILRRVKIERTQAQPCLRCAPPRMVMAPHRYGDVDSRVTQSHPPVDKPLPCLPPADAPADALMLVAAWSRCRFFIRRAPCFFEVAER